MESSKCCDQSFSTWVLNSCSKLVARTPFPHTYQWCSPVHLVGACVPRPLCYGVDLAHDLGCYLCSVYRQSGPQEAHDIWCLLESICLAMVAAGLAVDTKDLLIVAVVFIYLYYTFYGLSFLSMPFMYPAEINSQRTRNIGTSLSTMTNRCLCYVVVCVTAPGIANLGWT